MKLFVQIVRTVVNTVAVPVSLATDVVDPKDNKYFGHTEEAIERLKREAQEDPDEVKE